MRYIIIITLFFFLCACKQNQPVEQPVAQVFESALYRAEISGFIPKGTPYDDSVVMAQNYVRNWVTQKLLLHKAIENLHGEEADIQKQVEDYRTSLLIHRYKQKLIAQRLREDVSDSETEAYYEEHKSNFMLTTPIVKAVFFILSKNAPNMKEVRKWFKSGKEADQEMLEDYCLTNARKYDKFQNKWIEAKYLLNLIPGEYESLEKEILTKKEIEKEDEENYYFLRINEMLPDQTLAPLDYVREEITLILKNKKKLQFESELEKQINLEGVEKNYVKIY